MCFKNQSNQTTSVQPFVQTQPAAHRPAPQQAVQPTVHKPVQKQTFQKPAPEPARVVSTAVTLPSDIKPDLVKKTQ